MSDNVYVFKPRHEIERDKNLRDFIAFGKKLPLLNNKYSYDDNYWKGVCNFTIFGASSRQRIQDELLHESLVKFAKAYLTYEGHSPAATISRMTAIRAIHAVLGSAEEIDITTLTASDFDKFAQAARENLGQGAAYNAGRGLQNLAGFLQAKKIIESFEWKNPIKKAKEFNAIDSEVDKRRQDKMPDQRALDALAEISAHKDEDLSSRDIFTISVMTLLISAPSRGSEPFYLSPDCLHYQSMSVERAMNLGLQEEDVWDLYKKQNKLEELNRKEILSNPNASIKLMGIRWYSGKGYGYENKWVPTVMYEAVEKAVERLIKLSAGARAFAKLVEQTPLNLFPRHELCPDVKEDQLLTKEEKSLATGLDIYDFKEGEKRRIGMNNHLRKKKIAIRGEHNLSDLNKILRSSLPETFPYVDYKSDAKVKWSDALFAQFAYGYSEELATKQTELFMPTINTLNEDLAPTKKNKRNGELGNVKSIFQRWGYGDLSITSHQLRHMLDTMAAVNGMDGELRAKWAMRSDPKHNRYYDHTTPEEYGHDFGEAREKEVAEREGDSGNQIVVQIASPRTIQELNTKASLTAHNNEFGICLNSYLSEPCTKYRECLNCNQNVCVKGDDGKCQRIRDRLKKEKKLLKKDQIAVNNNVPGAEQWLQRRMLTVERAEQLLKMMEDPSIEDGALIKLDNIDDVSQLDRAMDANGKKRLPEIINYKRVTSVTVDEMLAPKEDSDISLMLEDLSEYEELWED